MLKGGKFGRKWYFSGIFLDKDFDYIEQMIMISPIFSTLDAYTYSKIQLEI